MPRGATRGDPRTDSQRTACDRLPQDAVETPWTSAHQGPSDTLAAKESLYGDSQEPDGHTSVVGGEGQQTQCYCKAQRISCLPGQRFMANENKASVTVPGGRAGRIEPVEERTCLLIESSQWSSSPWPP